MANIKVLALAAVFVIGLLAFASVGVEGSHMRAPASPAVAPNLIITDVNYDVINRAVSGNNSRTGDVRILSVTVKNTGNAAAPASITMAWNKDINTPRLLPGQSITLTGNGGAPIVTIQKTSLPWWIWAWADPFDRVVELDERDNHMFILVN